MTTPIILLKGIFIVALTAALVSFDLPKSWFAAGSDPTKYDMGIDKGAGQNGKNAATIRSNQKRIHGFGTLMQECNPGKYAGKKIKMTASVKSVNVKDWAGLWLRVDQLNSHESLAFDNMQDRPIKGTTDWKKYEIILDVPANASMLAYGALLSGTGQIWFQDITFEVVGDSEKTTGSINPKSTKVVQPEPTNLNFLN